MKRFRFQFSAALLLAIYCFIPCMSWAEVPVAEIHDLSLVHDLSPNVEYLEDSDSSITYEAIAAGRYQQGWQKDLQQVFKTKTEVRYWVRFTINLVAGAESVPAMFYVATQPGIVYELDFWIPSSSAQSAAVRQVSLGYYRPARQREIASYFYAVRLPITQSKLTIYGLVNNGSVGLRAPIPLRLTSMETWHQVQFKLHVIQISFYAILAALFSYNACLFLSLRKPEYGYYLMFLLCSALTCATTDGMVVHIFPDIPALKVRVFNTFGAATMMFYVLFLWQSLDHFSFLKHGSLIIKVFIGSSMITMLLCTVQTHKIAVPFIETNASFVLIFSLIIIALAIKRKIPTATYLFIAEACAVTGGTLFMLMMKGHLPISYLNNWSLHLGILAESILLSLAVAAKTRILQQQSIDNLSKYEKLYQQSNDGLFSVDINTLETKCNFAFAKLFGFNSIENYEAHRREHSLEPEVMSFIEEIRHLMKLKGPSISEAEFLVPTPNRKTPLWVSLSMQVFKDDGGKPVRLDGRMTDITEKKQLAEAEAEREIARRDKEISEAKNQAKSQFFASMSHEFRTPLTAILGYTEMASQANINTHERLDYIKTVDNSARHLLQLINDILDLSKIEEQKMDVEFIPVDLLQLLKNVNEFIWILAQKKAISFEITFQFPLPATITSDATRLKQALINLCSNSVKFTQKGFVRLHISCDLKTQMISFAIEDSGIGLKPEQIDKLFGAYAQAETSTARAFGGTGLGLFLSKQIANKLGGDIFVTSEYRVGSTFELRVNMGDTSNITWLESAADIIALTTADKTAIPTDTANDEPQQSELKKPGGAALKVLLAEDNPVNQKLFSARIRQLGAEVFTAGNGVEVLIACHQQSFQLILMDMEMPTMNGLTAVSYLRELGFELPIYALTGNTSEEDIASCIAAGCDGHLAKPLDVARLIVILESLN